MFDWITGFLNTIGFVGVALLMFTENVFPPIPSELIMPLAGFNAAQGNGNIVVVIIAGSLGSLAGALMWFYVGLWIGRDRVHRLAARHGRWLTVSPDEFKQAEDWFARHGGAAVFIGRLVPTVRTFISVPAGMARMPMGRFMAYSALGTAIWTTLLGLLGYFLESQYAKVEAWMNPVSNIVLAGIVGWYVWRVATYDRRTAARRAAD
ncbi:DedA family protein [Roseitranquillus sediminis]|uniref:DedA family protein n=1 Tax=Roseitranquillus sediminis TaxID=2809051 RepID=UPI001D0C231A|nr:DedA family protein [Roseitranquillus sediminis]MBM9594326.1 DedA family protein [Roseitranquillus sediminis]